MESSIDGPQVPQTDMVQSDSVGQSITIICLMCFSPHRVTLLASSCFCFFSIFLQLLFVETTENHCYHGGWMAGHVHQGIYVSTNQLIIC